MNTQLNPIRTLVVDDSNDECLLLSAELQFVPWIKLIGFVHDGLEAISYLRGVDEFKDREAFPYPDLMLLDLSMPRCGGMGVLDFVRRQFHRPRIVLWSNTLETVSVCRALRMGADMVCDKPTNRAELMEILHRIQMKAFQMYPVVPAAEDLLLAKA
jgi:two-component system response regulator